MEVTLENCADEPIHIPGSIQPHGYFLALHAADLRIISVSKNLLALTSTTLEALTDKHVSVLFNEANIEIIKKEGRSGQVTNHSPVNIEILPADIRFSAIINRQDDLILIDLETRDSGAYQPGELYFQSKDFVSRLSQTTSDQEIYTSAVQQIRELTGYDRVMMYKFDKYYNGQVVAESKTDWLNSFMHQHFPESDIPAQARKLYLQNPIRLIADVNAVPCPVLPADHTIDLSKSSLRSVSPMHIQYLRNMGVGASLSLSIVVDNRLWGLIACHHYEAKIIPNEIRAAAVFLGQIISYMLNVKGRSDFAGLEGKLQALAANLVEVMAHEIDFEDGLIKAHKTLLELVQAQGVAWNLTGKLQKFGNVPDDEEIDAIIDWVEKQHEKIVYHTENLPAHSPAFSKLNVTASGILVLPLSLANNQFMIWFRPEVIETKNWGGKPEKVIEFTDDGSHRLMPRSSFALWKETVRNTSLEWNEAEISIATKFRNSLMNYVVLKSERLVELNNQLEDKIKERTALLDEEIGIRRTAEEKLTRSLTEVKRSNNELEQFAYVASHDLQEPLRKIQAFGERLTMSKEELSDNSRDYVERMMRAAHRMQLLIQNLLAYSRVTTNFEPHENVSLNGLVNNVIADLQVLIKETDTRIETDDLGYMTGDETQLERLFQNLIQNAIKFSGKDNPPVIQITRHDTEKGMEIRIRDNGIGFEQKYEKKAFELFERLHSRLMYEGTGLGLAICKKIVERHNGEIHAESAVNQGTTIRMVFGS